MPKFASFIFDKGIIHMSFERESAFFDLAFPLLTSYRVTSSLHESQLQARDPYRRSSFARLGSKLEKGSSISTAAMLARKGQE